MQQTKLNNATNLCDFEQQRILNPVETVFDSQKCYFVLSEDLLMRSSLFSLMFFKKKRERERERDGGGGKGKGVAISGFGGKRRC
jgi:hypothetical protein